jgi:NADH-quinone oxidoreductase subunit L
MTFLAFICILLPLCSFLLLTFGEKKLTPFFASLVSVLATSVSLVLAIILFTTTYSSGQAITETFTWVQIGIRTVQFRIWLDFTSAAMFVLVNFISVLVQIFSTAYMAGERNYVRYFAYLGLFTFSMLFLLLTDNLLLIYIGWELVGVSSYLLIGFWQEKPAAARAAKKAFLLNRIGDMGFLFGIVCLYALYGELSLSVLQGFFSGGAPGNADILLSLAGIGLVVGAMGKSAQFPLSSWLPDAMEGPTPVSALIHAATMVAAGIYLLTRVSFLFTFDVFVFIVLIGAITAFMAGFAALSQHDIKKVLAYSTISQLGFMLVGVGLNMPNFALFHLFTHAFFKACLFLCAGSVIHSLHHASHSPDFDPQDMRMMGGLRHRLPITFYAYTIAAMSLAGLPFFSGFLSKDLIIAGLLYAVTAFQGNSFFPLVFALMLIAFVLLLATIFMTAFYITRQWYLVFMGTYRGKKEDFTHIVSHEYGIKIPLMVLGFLSFGFIFSIHPFHAVQGWFLSSLSTNYDLGTTAGIAAILSVALALGGMGLAWFFYAKNILASLRTAFKNSIFYRLSFNFWYLDSFYTVFLKKIALWLSAVFAIFDTKINFFIHLLAKSVVVFGYIASWFDRFFIDGIVNSFAAVVYSVGGRVSALHGANIQFLIKTMLIVFSIIIGFILFW